MANIMFDIDGVLADFILGFTREACQLGYLERPYSTEEQASWEFNQLSWPQQISIWDYIRSSNWWWTNLPALVSPVTFAALNTLQMTNQVIFCTNRRGKHIQLQTKYWLANNGIVNPAVVVTERKGEVARALDIDYSIDDQVHNANCVHWIADTVPCRSYLLDRPYNRVGRIKNVRVVASVEEFMEELTIHE